MPRYRAAIIGLTGIAASPAPAAPDPVLGTVVPHSHAASYADRIVFLADGRVVGDLLDPTPAEILGRMAGLEPATAARKEN